MSEPALGLAGDGGRLATTVRALLTRHFDVTDLPLPPPAVPDRCVAVLAVTDRWRPDWSGMDVAGDVPWLPVHIEVARAILGPVTRRGHPGCARCAGTRRRAARLFPDEQNAMWERHGPRLRDARSPYCHATAADVVAGLVVTEIMALTAGGVPATRDAVVRVDLGTLAVRRHRFLPDPSCDQCGELPADGREAVRVTLRVRRKPHPTAARVGDLAARERDLLDTYVDGETGVVREVSGDATATFAGALALACDPHAGTTVYAYGRTRDLRSARVTAVAEALERLGGARPGARRTVVRGTYREMGDRAVDPKRLGLYPDDRYAIPGFPFARYHDDLDCAWVHGFSLTRDEPVLVPADVAYYRRQPGAGPPFVLETSNGCALGSCLEEAILHGLLEVAERDAFLLAWYSRTGVYGVDLGASTDRAIPLMAERIRQRTGYDVYAGYVATDHAIPCYWVLGVDRTGDGVRPAAVCAAGAGLGADPALAGALLELATVIEMRGRNYDTQARARAERMVRDPSLVSTMEDHSLLYSHPAAFDRLAFLTRPERWLTPRDIDDRAGWPAYDDLLLDLREAVHRFARHGLEVLVVDQTIPEHRAGGLACVKVIVPGLVPMTFGHHARRVDGIPRLLHLAHDLGYRDRPLEPAELNPHPHPFP